MDITALRSFREIHRQGSISLAARALDYTQSAVSRQIAGLENSLGATLLERHARGVRLTPAGELLLTHAAVILQRVEHAEREVAALHERPAVRLRVGAVASVSATLLPQALTALAAEVPEAHVTFSEDFTPLLLARLHDGDLDVVVVTDYPPGISARPGITLVHLLEEPLACVLPQQHPLAGRDTIDLADLAGETWVEDHEGAASVLTLACAKAGFTPRIDIHCGSWLGKQAFVAAGHGVALTPRLLAPTLRGDVVARPLADPPHRNVYAATRSRPVPHAARAFVRALQRTVATHVREPTDH